MATGTSTAIATRSVRVLSQRIRVLTQQSCNTSFQSLIAYYIKYLHCSSLFLFSLNQQYREKKKLRKKKKKELAETEIFLTGPVRNSPMENISGTNS
jgi:hypothetical protein